MEELQVGPYRGEYETTLPSVLKTQATLALALIPTTRPYSFVNVRTMSPTLGRYIVR